MQARFCLAAALLCWLTTVSNIQEAFCLKRPIKTATDCPQLRLANGIAKVKANRRVIRFSCQLGYSLFGDRVATCNRGKWEVMNSFPICVRPSCVPMAAPKNGIKTELGGGAILYFVCNSGYSLNGSTAIYCDGLKWNDTAPDCQPETSEPEVTCDFESADDMCGWSQDSADDFDWTRQSGVTPSGTMGTGPTHDHTRGRGQLEGNYLYIESSSPRKENHTAQLVSPVYKPALSQDACFIFWYHMYGLHIGGLNVYVKPDGVTLDSVQPQLSLRGPQGNRWLRAVVPLRSMDHNFQMIVEAVCGSSYLGDTAVDDFWLANGTDCTQIVTESPDAFTDSDDYNISDSSQSCRSRCFTDTATPVSQPISSQDGPVLLSCACNSSCLDNPATCCQDYADYCVIGASLQQARQEVIQSSTSDVTTLPLLAGLLGGATLLVVLVTLALIVVKRRRRGAPRRPKGSHRAAEDSDVRFLTADEVLDFSLARRRSGSWTEDHSL